jgi:O-antigen ligase
MKIYKNSYYYLDYFFFLLFPFSFVIGAGAVEVFSFLLIIHLFKKADKFFYKKYCIFIYIFLIFYCYFLFRSLIFSLDFEKIKSILFYFRFALFTLGFIFFLDKFRFDNKLILKVVYFSFLILIADAIFQYFYGQNIIGLKLYHIERASGFFGKELILGSFLLRFLPFLFLILILFKINIKKNIIYLSFFFGFYYFGIFISGERTSFALLILAIVFLFFILKDFKKVIALSLILFSFLILVTYFFKKEGVERMFITTMKQIKVDVAPNLLESNTNNLLESNSNLSNLNINKSKYYIFSREHHGHYVVAIRMFLDNPIIGQGPRSFRYLCSEEKFIKADGICTTHPHNTYLQLLAETGLIGFLLFCSLIIFFTKEIVTKFITQFKNDENKMNQMEKVKYVSIIAILVNFFPFVPSGNFFNNWLSFICYYPLSFYLYSINKLHIK